MKAKVEFSESKERNWMKVRVGYVLEKQDAMLKHYMLVECRQQLLQCFHVSMMLYVI